LFVCELFIKIANTHVKHTADHHDSFPARTPDVTSPGNAAGIAIGQIRNTIVPPSNDIRAMITNTLTRPMINFSIVLID
jgi:hypothetical protein